MAARRLLWPLGLAIILAAGLWVLVSFWQKIQSPSIGALVDLVPREAKALVVVRGLPQIAMEFGLWKGDSKAAVFSTLAEAGAVLGIDLSDQESLLKTGIDITAPFGMSLHLVEDREIHLVYLPLASFDQAQETLGLAAEHQGWNLETESHEDYTIVQVIGSGWMYTRYGDHLIAAQSGEAESALLKKLLDGETGSVRQTEWYSCMEPLVSGPWQVLALVDPVWAGGGHGGAAGLEVLAGLQTVGDSRFADLTGIGASLAIASDKMRLRYQEAGKEGVEHRAHQFVGTQKDRFAPRIAGLPLGAARLAIDPVRVFAWQKENDSQAATQLLDALGSTDDVNVEQDLIPYLGSPLSMAVLRDESGGDPVGSFVFWLPLKSGHGFDALLERGARSLGEQGESVAQEERDGVSWYHQDGPIPVGWAVVDEHLVFTFGGTGGRSRLTTNPQQSFLTQIKRKAFRQELVSGHDMAVFIDLPAIVAIFGREFTESLSAQQRKYLDSFGELVSWVDTSPRMLISEWTLYPARPGAFDQLVAGSP